MNSHQHVLTMTTAVDLHQWLQLALSVGQPCCSAAEPDDEVAKTETFFFVDYVCMCV